MPRSKRSKVVSLTKTEKKTKAHKEELITQIRENAQKWKYAWVFTVGDMRNAALKDIRSQWKGTGRMFCARNTVMVKALGSTPEEEVRPGLHKITEYLHSGAGIFFTDWDPAETQAWLVDYKRPDFARAGNTASRDVALPEGPVCDQTPSPDPPAPLTHALEPRLRALGLSTRLVRGVPTLTAPHVVCKAGQQLTAEQAALLKLLGIQMSEFRIKCLCWWGEEEGLTVLEADKAAGGDEKGEEDDDDEEMSS
ncbi:mRNA turnover and ribosome assembly protein [Ceratobasidium sp. 394]|nr:mRNA turnover and ribosome assembly protein [Ceratobasidium sp. 394]KAG9088605.1 mRNA turnover and ribosome assembly protein [Ceratobasidium sp. UAMH 11750]